MISMYPWFSSGRCQTRPLHVAPCKSCCSMLRACRSWPLISITARRLRTLFEMLANSVTTAPIITSVIAIAISISTSVKPPTCGRADD